MTVFRAGNLIFFIEQWERVIRWKDRCSLSSDLDFYEAFFINAYLKDWMTQWLKENNKDEILKKMRARF